ncbi:hypothetical protein HDU84_006324 [Entophlyctis sp. JEL0112]|nr:hypothetical protein HDU84_006324 [Entophlyctis sp. JEL0112]
MLAAHCTNEYDWAKAQSSKMIRVSDAAQAFNGAQKELDGMEPEYALVSDMEFLEASSVDRAPTRPESDECSDSLAELEHEHNW